MSPASRPQLASRARLRLDRQTGGVLLLWPERGLALSPTAADVLRLCTGAHTVVAIVACLAERYDHAGTDRLSDDVLAFLCALEDRGLVADAG